MISPPPRSPAEPSAGSRAATVLVVEDVVLVRMLICDYLRDAGFTIVEVTSGDEALAVLATPLQIDVVFADIYMPNSSIDGIELARWIQANKPAVKVVLTSGVADLKDKAREVTSGGALIDKPYDRGQVVRRLREVLGLS